LRNSFLISGLIFDMREAQRQIATLEEGIKELNMRLNMQANQNSMTELSELKKIAPLFVVDCECNLDNYDIPLIVEKFKESSWLRHSMTKLSMVLKNYNKIILSYYADK